jgi:hypothetical protein
LSHLFGIPRLVSRRGKPKGTMKGLNRPENFGCNVTILKGP